MDSKNQSFSIVLFLLVCISVISTTSHSINQDESLIAKRNEKLAGLVDAGSFNGKTYFRENTFAYTWWEAEELCKDNSLEPVEIESEDELNYLRTQLPPSYYWTSGMDTQRFTWSSGNEINVTLIPGNRLCLVLHYQYLGLYSRDCDYGSYALCQAKPT